MLSDTGINWNDLDVFSDAGINWTNINDLSAAGINWLDIDVMSDTGINWTDIDTLSTAGINWASINDLSTAGINWLDIDVMSDALDGDAIIFIQVRGRGQTNPIRKGSLSTNHKKLTGRSRIARCHRRRSQKTGIIDIA